MFVLRLLPRAAFVLLLILSVLSPLSIRASEPLAGPAAPEYQLLLNSGMETYDPPYTQYRGADCQVASNWDRFWYDAPEPYWMDTRVFAYSLGSGWVERIEGETSQMILATEPYTAGLQQQVTGLTPGVGYGFHAAMLTIFESSAPPAVDLTMIKEVGMDPTGGTDPQASTVVWSEADAHDEGPWSIDLRTAVFAESPAMTVFIRVTSLYESRDWPHINLSFLDSAILARTPEVSAVSPPSSDDVTFAVRWDNAVPAPGGSIRWYDVQWLDEAEGVWHDWFERTTDLQAQFTGEEGHAYRFRARAWQRYDNGAHLYGPYRADGDTRTELPALRLAGLVASPEGLPLSGATVTVLPAGYSDTSGLDGRYDVMGPPQSGPQNVTVSHPNWLSPAPVYGLTFGLTETEHITWTLRPPDDALTNGGFEADLSGWSVVGDEDVVPAVVSEPAHTGQGALALGGTAPVSFTVGATQTVVLSDTWEPGLAFWYYPETSGGVFDVVLTVVTETISTTIPVTPTSSTAGPGAARWLTEPVTITVPVTITLAYTPSLDVGGWQQRWYRAGPPGTALSGTVTVNFRFWYDPARSVPGDGGLSGFLTGAGSGNEALAAVYLDEVSLGRSSGGPHQVYLPLTVRSY